MDWKEALWVPMEMNIWASELMNESMPFVKSLDLSSIGFLMTLHYGYNVSALLPWLASNQSTLTVLLQVVSVTSGAQKFAGPDTICEKRAGPRCHGSSSASSARTERMDRVVGRRERSREREREWKIRRSEIFLDETSKEIMYFMHHFIWDSLISKSKSKYRIVQNIRWHWLEDDLFEKGLLKTK